MNHYVYEITNIVNGRKYIGKRSCRCEIERDRYMGSGFALRNAKEKYGALNFEKKILKVFDTEEEAFAYEKLLMDELMACESEIYYNIAEGGKGGNKMKGKTREEVREIHRLRGLSIRGENHVRYGKELSVEHKERISESNKEDWKNNPKRLNAIRSGEKNHFYGKELDIAHRMKIKKALTGRVKSENEKMNISKSKMGGSNPMARKVVCITTKEVFDSMAEAGRKYGIKSIGIVKCCKGKGNTSGEIDGVRLEWKYYDEYLKGLD